MRLACRLGYHTWEIRLTPARFCLACAYCPALSIGIDVPARRLRKVGRFRNRLRKDAYGDRTPEADQ